MLENYKITTKSEYLKSRENFDLDFSTNNFQLSASKLVKNYKKQFPFLELYDYSENQDIFELKRLNEMIANIMYSPTLLSKMETSSMEEITCLSERNTLKILSDKMEILENIDFSELALIAIRPEIFFLSDAILNYIEQKGYNILVEENTVIEFRRYWSLYNHGLIHPDSRFDFPTRTLAYMSGPTKVLVLKKDGIRNLQKNFNSLHKGIRGNFVKDTLRGDIIYNGLHRAKSENEHLFFKSLDPLGVYRSLVSGRVESDQSHQLYEDPFLYYAGAGIHTPEDYEQFRDTGILLSKSSLEKLI